MRIRVRSALIAIVVLTVILVLIVEEYPSSAIRIVLGVPFLLFAPGYTLAAALFPKRKGMNGTEKIALSLGLSVAVVSLIGLILNYSPWGIRLEPLLNSVAFFVFAASGIAWLRQAPQGHEDESKEVGNLPRENSVWNGILTLIMMIAIVGALATTAFFIANPKPGESFTQFYMRGQPGKEAIYPSDMEVGQTGVVVLGVTNHEGTEVTYRIQVLVNGEKNSELGPKTLADGEEWLADVSFAPKSAGLNQKVEFLLFRTDETLPYLEPLYLWIDVD